MIGKRLNKLNKKVESSTSNNQKLSKVESEVMYLLTKEFLTPRQVAIRRQTSFQATYKVIENLKKKGVLNKVFKEVEYFQCPIQPFQGIRVHGLEFNIKIIFKGNSYKSRLLKSNVCMIDGNTVRLYNGSLEVYGNKSFFGDDEHKAFSKAINYFNKFFIRLENDFKIVIVKDRSQNISLVKCEFAEVQNELSKDCGDKAEKIKIYAREDGKLWFSIDNSFNLHEAETHHIDTGKRDMKIIKAFFDDLRFNPVTTTEILGVVAITQKQVDDVVKCMHTLVKLVTPPVVNASGNSSVKPDHVG